MTTSTYSGQPSTPQTSTSNVPAAVAAQKKNPDMVRLSVFLNECLSLGSLKGFKHFEFYLRGKEELLLRVNNQEKKKTYANWRLPASSVDDLAKSYGKLFLSKRAQKMLFDQALPVAPASPCDRELEKDSSKTVFLIAGYARYKRPYVWLRSNHTRLVKQKPNQEIDTDNPVKLETVADWATKDIRLWQMIDEIMSLAVAKKPDNPFEVDHDYFNSLSVEGSLILSGAMLDFLRKIYLRKPAYSAHVMEDIKILQERHFLEFNDLVRRNMILKE